MNLHHYYDQLTDDARKALDAAFATLMGSMAAQGFALNNSDAAESAIDGCARAILENNVKRTA